jgi:hypothetical protein
MFTIYFTVFLFVFVFLFCSYYYSYHRQEFEIDRFFSHFLLYYIGDDWFVSIYFLPGEFGELAKAIPIKYLAAKLPEYPRRVPKSSPLLFLRRRNKNQRHVCEKVFRISRIISRCSFICAYFPYVAFAHLLYSNTSNHEKKILCGTHIHSNKKFFSQEEKLRINAGCLSVSYASGSFIYFLWTLISFL